MNPEEKIEWEYYLAHVEGASIEDRRAFLAGYREGYGNGNRDGFSDGYDAGQDSMGGPVA